LESALKENVQTCFQAGGEAMKVYSPILRRKAFALVVNVSLLVFSTTVFSQEFTTPEALLEAWTNLITRECDLECSKRVAGMYSQQILQLNKDALVRTLRYSTDRTNDALILFGKDIGQKELVQMSPTDVFAHQLLYRDQSIPDEYRYAQTEILRTKYLSPNEVKVVVRRSGLPAAPQMSEEEIIRLIKEGGEWKIGY
jgi:hypothetical protein